MSSSEKIKAFKEDCELNNVILTSSLTENQEKVLWAYLADKYSSAKEFCRAEGNGKSIFSVEVADLTSIGKKFRDGKELGDPFTNYCLTNCAIGAVYRKRTNSPFRKLYPNDTHIYVDDCLPYKFFYSFYDVQKKVILGYAPGTSSSESVPIQCYYDIGKIYFNSASGDEAYYGYDESDNVWRPYNWNITHWTYRIKTASYPTIPKITRVDSSDSEGYIIHDYDQKYDGTFLGTDAQYYDGRYRRVPSAFPANSYEGDSVFLIRSPEDCFYIVRRYDPKTANLDDLEYPIIDRRSETAKKKEEVGLMIIGRSYGTWVPRFIIDYYVKWLDKYRSGVWNRYYRGDSWDEILYNLYGNWAGYEDRIAWLVDAPIVKATFTADSSEYEYDTVLYLSATAGAPGSNCLPYYYNDEEFEDYDVPFYLLTPSPRTEKPFYGCGGNGGHGGGGGGGGSTVIVRKFSVSGIDRIEEDIHASPHGYGSAGGAGGEGGDGCILIFY